MRHKRLGVWGDSHGRNLYTQFIRMLTGGMPVSACLLLPGCCMPPCAEVTATSDRHKPRHRTRHPCSIVCAAAAAAATAGTFDDKVDELAKHYQDGFWHGISATGETAANYLMGDLHLSLRWHTTIPRMAHEIYQL